MVNYPQPECKTLALQELSAPTSCGLGEGLVQILKLDSKEQFYFSVIQLVMGKIPIIKVIIGLIKQMSIPVR